MINIKITPELIEILKQEGFFSDTLLTQYFILQSLNSDEKECLDALDDFLKSKRMVIQYYELVRRGLLEESPDRNSFVITDKGKKFLWRINAFIMPPPPEKPRTEAPVPNDWIDSWL